MATQLQQAKNKVANYQKTGVADGTPQTLMAFLDHLRGDGRTNIIQDVQGCNSDAELRQLSDHLISSVLRPVRASGGTTATVTPSPRPGAAEAAEGMAESMGSPQSRKKQLKQQCLLRDAYKSVVDNSYEREAPENALPGGSRQGLRIQPTVAAHIIPLALAGLDDHTEASQTYRGTIWDALVRCFPGLAPRIAYNLLAINDPRNAFTASKIVHDDFGAFYIALKPQYDSNVYRVKTYPKANTPLISLLPSDRIVRFSSNGTNFPVPDRYLLETHFMIAEILHASGQAEIILKSLDEYYDTPALATDGSTNIRFVVEAQ